MLPFPINLFVVLLTWSTADWVILRTIQGRKQSWAFRSEETPSFSIPNFSLTIMFRNQLVKSVAAACRSLSRPAVSTRLFSISTIRSMSVLPSSCTRFNAFSTQRRLFSESASSAGDIKKRIEACTYNDAAKEKIIQEEAKRKNFSALRELGEQ